MFDAKSYQIAYRIAHREEAKAYQKEYRKRCASQISKQRKEYWQKNRERCLAAQRECNKKRKAKIIAANKKHKLAKKQRVPKWLTHADFKYIEKIYEVAAFLTERTGIEYQVDHIIPLNGKNISGLHVPSNLQILTKEENLTKSNYFRGI